jgi:predicted MFS family arabinose efflux permease
MGLRQAVGEGPAVSFHPIGQTLAMRNRSLSGSHANPESMSIALLGVLAFGYCIAFIDAHLPAVAAPLLKVDLQLTDAQLGLLTGPAYALLYVVGVLTTGRLIYSAHRLRALAACVATWMTGMVMIAFGHSFAELLVGRALVGLGQAVFLPLGLGLVVAHADPSWRARAMVVLTASTVIGRSFSMLFGGATLALFAHWTPTPGFAHWRLLFLVMTAPNLLLIALLLRCKELPNASVPRPQQVYGPLLQAFWARPWVISAYFCGAAACVLMVRTIGAWAPSVLQREQGLTPAAAALVFGVATLVASPLGHLLGGILVDKRGEKHSPMLVSVGALLLAVPVLCALPWANSAFVACGVLALASLLGGGAAAVALSGWPMMLSPALRDAGLRIFLVFTVVIGESLGPWVTGVVSDHRGAGGHALSWALTRVCLAAAIAGIATALLVCGRWQRAAPAAAA